MRNRLHLPIRLAHFRDNLVRGFLVGDLNVFTLVFCELGLEKRRLTGIEKGVDGPVFLGDEGANFPLPLDDQSQSHGLHAPGGETPADLVPKKRRNLVADQAVENAPRLLGVDQVGVQLTRMLKSGADGPRRNLIERDAEDVLWIHRPDICRLGRLLPGRFFLLLIVGVAGFGALLSVVWFDKAAGLGEHLRQMGANGFTLAIRVTGKEYGGRRARRYSQFLNNFLLAGDDLELRLEGFVGSRALPGFPAGFRLAFGRAPFPSVFITGQ